MRLTLRFYAELNDHLPASHRQVAFEAEMPPEVTAGQAVAAQGVPVSEVDLVLRNGESVPMDCALRDGDRLSVYPVFERFEVGAVQRVRESSLREPRFAVPPQLRRVGLYLRALGFDACVGETSDAGRIVITPAPLPSDHRLTHALSVSRASALGQVREIVERLDLGSRLDSAPRCLRCNVALERETPDSAPRCSACGRVVRNVGLYQRLRVRVRSASQLLPLGGDAPA